MAYRRLSINNNDSNHLTEPIRNPVFGTLNLDSDKYFPEADFKFQLLRVAELSPNANGIPQRVISSNSYWIDKREADNNFNDNVGKHLKKNILYIQNRNYRKKLALLSL